MTWIIAAEFPLERDLSDIDRTMTAHGIEHRFTEEQGRQRLWLADPANVQRVMTLLDSGVLPPSAAADVRSGVQPPSADVATSHERPQQILMLKVKLSQAPLSAACVILGLIGYLSFFLQLEALYMFLAFVPPQQLLETYQFWHVITPTFLHFSFLHILFNGLWIWEVGKRLEIFLGWRPVCVLFLICALVANIAQYYTSQSVVFGGLSGVVYGYFGCIFFLFRRFNRPLLFLPSGLFIFMLIWLVAGFLGLIDVFISGSIANWAHLGGLVAGCIFGALCPVSGNSSGREPSNNSADTH